MNGFWNSATMPATGDSMPTRQGLTFQCILISSLDGFMKAACQGDDAGEEASQLLYADSQRIVCANVRRVLTRVQTATNATRAADED
jgi:hypothetical protein